MDSGDIIRFVDNRPFEPFSVFVADGREIAVPHLEMVSAGVYAQSLRILHDSGQVEVIDAAMICSLRTLHPSSTSFEEQPPPEE